MASSSGGFARTLTGWVAIGALLLQSVSPAFSQGLTPDAGASAGNRPSIDHAPNGVPSVNIVTPNAAGLSHNKFTDYNVGRQGVILNNSKSYGKSVLGGYMFANPNLANGPAARTILNEVTSANRSLLEGYTEVFGAGADVIVANPNGITCNGCGFINIPRATLTTGRPVISPLTGALTGLSVDSGVVTVGELGLDATTADYFDIVSRSAVINGKIFGNDVGVFAGRNDFDYIARNVVAKADDGSGKPVWGIDSSLLGGMYAGRITLIGTEAGVGVKTPPQFTASRGGMTLTANGRLVIGKASAKGKIAARSTSGRVEVVKSDAGDAIYSETGVSLVGKTGVTVVAGGIVSSSADVVLQAETGNVDVGAGATIVAGLDPGGSLSQTGKLRIEAAQDINAAEASLLAGQSLALLATSIDLSRAANDATGDVVSLGELSLTARYIAGTNARIEALGGIALSSAGDLDIADGTYVAGTGILVTAHNVVTSATLATNGSVDFASTGDVTNTGAISALQNVTVTAARDIDNDGTFNAAGRIDLTSGGTLTNNGELDAVAGMRLDAGTTIKNAGRAISDGAVAFTATGDIENRGRIESATQIALTAGGTLTNTAGALVNTRDSVAIKTGLDLVNAGAVGTAGTLSFEIGRNGTNTGLIYAAHSGDIRIDGVLTNDGGDIIVGEDLRIAGLSGTRAGGVVNASGLIEAARDLSVVANAITNTTPAPVIGTSRASSSTGSHTGGGDHQVTTTVTTTVDTEHVDSRSPPAQMLAGRDMRLDAATITNAYSQIAASGDMVLTGATLVNTARDLLETTTVETKNEIYERWCSKRIFGICVDHDSQTTTTVDTAVSSRTIGTEHATIEAGGSITGSFTGQIDNVTMRGGAGQVGLVSGGIAGPGGSSGAGSQSLDTEIANLIGRDQLFTTNPGPGTAPLVETRPEFANLGQVLGSDYFLSRLGADPQNLQRRLGDSYLEERLIRDQIFALTGKRLLSGVGSDTALIKQLYDNAVAEAKALDLKPGVALTADQVKALTHDIVWLEPVLVDQQIVLAPKVYLQPGSNGIAGAGITGRTIDVAVPRLSNSGTISAREGLSFTIPDSLTNIGGTITAPDIAIKAGTFANLSGLVKGVTVSVAANEIINSTLVTRDAMPSGYADHANQIAEISGSDSVTLSAAGNFVSQGGRVTSGGELGIVAGGSILVEALALDRNRDDTYARGFDRAFKREHIAAELTAGDALTLAAGEDIKLAGVHAEAGGDALLVAGGGVAITSVTDVDTHEREMHFGGSGWLSTKTDRSLQEATSSTLASTLSAGGDAKVEAKTGDVTLDAAKVTAGGSAELKADQGQVALLAEKDSSYLKRDERVEDPFWWNSRDQGHYTETTQHVEITAGGGLKITAGKGVVAEIEAKGSLAGAVGEMAQKPGLAWTGALQSRNDVTWRQVSAAAEHWDHKAQGLTEAGAAVIALAVAVASAGTLSQLSAALASALPAGIGGTTVAQAAISAGLRTLVTQASISLVNNQGDIGKVLKQLGSSDSLKSLATAMIAAGLVSALPADLVPALSAQQAAVGGQLSFAEQLQANVVRGVVQAAVSTGVEGRNLEQALLSEVKNAGVTALTAEVASEIGDAAHSGQIDTASQLIAHAALGCGAGAALGGGGQGCGSGAVGAVVGEVAAELYVRTWVENALTNPATAKMTPAQLQQELVQMRALGVDIGRLTGGLAAAVATGDASTGAATGGNAAQHNAAGAIPIAVGACEAAPVPCLALAAVTLATVGALYLGGVKVTSLEELQAMMGAGATSDNPPPNANNAANASGGGGKGTASIDNSGQAGDPCQVNPDPATCGGRRPTEIGKDGEQRVRAQYDIGDKQRIEVSGRTRIPDGLMDGVLSEVKNTSSLSYSRQLQDFVKFARENNLSVNLYIRDGTKLSGPLRQLIDEKVINVIKIP